MSWENQCTFILKEMGKLRFYFNDFLFSDIMHVTM